MYVYIKKIKKYEGRESTTTVPNLLSAVGHTSVQRVSSGDHNFCWTAVTCLATLHRCSSLIIFPNTQKRIP